MLRWVFACCMAVAIATGGPAQAAGDADALRTQLERAERAERESGPDSPAAIAAIEALLARERTREDYSIDLSLVREWTERVHASRLRLRGVNDAATVRALIEVAAMRARLEKGEEAIALADAARAAADANGDAWLVAQAAFAQGNTRFWARELDTGAPFLEDALARTLALAPTLPREEVVLLEARCASELHPVSNQQLPIPCYPAPRIRE